MKALKTLCWISAVYDLALALPLLLAPEATARLFGAPAPVPVLNAELNGLFTLTLGLGYLWAAGDVVARRGYLWLAGVVVKGPGALLFVIDHFARGSPASFLLFAASDGGLAVLTTVLLLKHPPPKA